MEREVMMVCEGLIILDGKIGFDSPKHKHHAIDSGIMAHGPQTAKSIDLHADRPE